MYQQLFWTDVEHRTSSHAVSWRSKLELIMLDATAANNQLLSLPSARNEGLSLCF
jgi:hypothetical protein